MRTTRVGPRPSARTGGIQSARDAGDGPPDPVEHKHQAVLDQRDADHLVDLEGLAQQRVGQQHDTEADRQQE